jgi:hypothetical protein
VDAGNALSTLGLQRWASRLHVGEARPRVRVMVRLGRFVHGNDPWPTRKTDPLYINAKIYGEKASKPWRGRWLPTGGWVEVPNVAQVELTQDFENNGITVATVHVDNVVMTEHNDGPFGDIYHLIERGYLSPFRGGAGPSRVPTPPANDWYGLLNRKAQVRVYEGYGEDTLEPTFSGLIDDCDVASHPDTIIITARDFGQALTDQAVFGHVITPQLPEPVVFRSLGVGSDGSEGTGVGYDASASTTRAGHPARFVNDDDVKTLWISHDHTTPDNTEWVQVRLPRGRYESFAIHAGQPGMEMFVGIFARNDGLGGEPCTVDDEPIEDGWVRPSELPDPTVGGNSVPGGNGGWPYVKHWSSVSDKGHTNTLSASFEVGDGSVLRVGFRNLYKVTPGVYRASVARFRGVKRSDPTPVRVRPVGEKPEASSTRPASTDENFHASNVVDAHRETRWLSQDHTAANVTEWVQIRLPAGRYDSIRLDPAYAGMDIYIGVYARKGSKKSAQMDDNNIPDGWVDTGLGDVPGANGGWAFVKQVPNLDRPDNPAKIPLGHKFELGKDSVIRVGFRNLYRINHEVYRTGANRLVALTRTGVEQPEEDTAKTQVIQVGDLSDVVKVVLRWAGFKEWDIEPVGAPLKGTASFNRSHTLMDIIKRAEEVTGYVFYMQAPTGEDLSLGIPSFRSNQAIADSPAGMPEIHDTDMIGDISAKATDEPLKYIIRVRGKTSEKYGQTLGGDKTSRVMAVYRPPWTLRDRLAGVIRHVTHTEEKLAHTNQCMVMAQLIALQEALVASAAEVTIPGTWAFDLNEHVALVDTGTGLNTRLFIARRSSTYVGGKDAKWQSTLGGALIDTDDIRGVIADLRATLSGMGMDPNKISLGDPFTKT